MFLLLKIPPCIFGCKVFTLPPSISGDPVYLETSVHLYLSFFICLYVPPELINFILYFESVDNNFFKLFLFDKEISGV